MRIALLAVMLSGCGLYFGGGGGGGIDAGCKEAVGQPAQELRDPYTGQCEPYGGGGGCGVYNGTNGALYPNWASCSSSCLGHPEASCYATAGCQAEMIGDSYWGCFPVEPGDLAPPQDCTTLDVYACSQNDACIAVYGYSSTTDKTATQFVKCMNEAAPPPPPPPPPACSTLMTEAACLMRSDCDTVYTGSDCTCDKSGCVCQTETFASCQAN